MAQTALRRGTQEDGNSDYFTGCPIGGGFIWYGLPTKIPSNCRICENQTMAIASFAKLNENISDSWGGTAGLNIRLPDFRGRFPRGVASGSANDPDRATRTFNAAGGNTGDAVGSVQVDEFKSHTHSVETRVDTHGVDPGGSYWRGVQTVQSGGAGGNETRPKNAYVYFVIRVS
jgi:hypothetical protein